MTETETDWLSEPATDEVASDSAATSTTPIGRRTLAVRAGLLAVGAVVGGIVVTTVHHGSTSTTSPTSFGVPQGGTGQLAPQGGPPGGFSGGFGGGGLSGGGLSGEQRLSGTLVSVGSSTVTVRTSSGTATYAVTSSTEIVRNGQVVAVTALKAGDPVLVHVYPSGSSSRLTVERLFAGSGLTGTSQERLSAHPAREPSLGP